MAHFIASKPSICMSQRNNLDACPIRTLLKVVERDVSYGVTVQVFFFSHKCGQFSWCRALNVEVAATFPNISSYHCLHDSVVFPRVLLSGAGSYIRYSRCAFTPRDP